MEVVAPNSIQSALSAMTGSDTTLALAGIFNENVTQRKPGLKVIPKAGTPARVNGKVWHPASATDAVWRVDNDSKGQLGPISNAARVTIGGTPDRIMEITNENTDIGWTLDAYNGPPPDDNVLEYANVHHCGSLAQTNHHHGGYINWGKRAKVRHVLFHNNRDRAIQVWTEPGLGGQAQDALIEYCMAFVNGEGYSVGGAGSGGAKITRCIGGYTVSSYSAYASNGPGPGVVYDDNILWDPPEQRNDESVGVTVTRLKIVDPKLTGTRAELEALRYNSPFSEVKRLFQLQPGSPAAGYGPSWLQPAAVPPEPPPPQPPPPDPPPPIPGGLTDAELKTLTQRELLYWRSLAGGFQSWGRVNNSPIAAYRRSRGWT